MTKAKEKEAYEFLFSHRGTDKFFNSTVLIRAINTPGNPPDLNFGEADSIFHSLLQKDLIIPTPQGYIINETKEKEWNELIASCQDKNKPESIVEQTVNDLYGENRFLKAIRNLRAGKGSKIEKSIATGIIVVALVSTIGIFTWKLFPHKQKEDSKGSSTQTVSGNNLGQMVNANGSPVTINNYGQPQDTPRIDDYFVHLEFTNFVDGEKLILDSEPILHTFKIFIHVASSPLSQSPLDLAYFNWENEKHTSLICTNESVRKNLTNAFFTQGAVITIDYVKKSTR